MKTNTAIIIFSILFSSLLYFFVGKGYGEKLSNNKQSEKIDSLNIEIKHLKDEICRLKK